MGTGTFVVASGDLGELMPIICAKIQIWLSEHYASNHRWVKDLSHQFGRLFLPVNDLPITVDFRPFTGCSLLSKMLCK